ncbi:helix-turn-helix domain-containing protein [Sphingomonas hankookensis]|uniref:XRE family transcriptional regulator n=1 Tax=Sphingomonas hengshuiensis TaxID=1609977 RepID=A0A2W5B1Q9_9SPHN|nr:MAG: XRE family transcriptional regulator [Sphingomonas hengshuiensis]
MITAIREVRRAQGLTLEEVAIRCVPPTTAQTIGRLETGTRTVSIGWLNRIAAALAVDAADLVRLPDRPDVPVAAVLDGSGVAAPRRAMSVTPPRAEPELVAMIVQATAGDYRAGDMVWCRRLAPADYIAALHRDVLAPAPAGRFAFGRLLAFDGDMISLLPTTLGAAPAALVVPWIAVAERLVRNL